jgi:hypothetical protein
MDGKNFMRTIKHLGSGGLRILSSITEVATVIFCVDIESGLSLCGILFNGNKNVILSGGFNYGRNL